MKIRKDEFETVLNHLVEKRWEGEEFVAFPHRATTLSITEMYMFSNDYEATQFCFEMKNEFEDYTYLPIRSTYRAMTEVLNDDIFFEKEGDVVDISKMVSDHYSRLEEKQIENNQTAKDMNMKNLEYLQDQVKITGFGDLLAEALREAVKNGNPEFKLNHETVYGNDKVKAELNFTQSKQSDMYFFNSYKVQLEKENKAAIEQLIYINKGKNVTLKEAYNLLDGRSVNKDLTNKDGHKYNAWLQLDFKQTETNGNFKVKPYYESYGYDLEAAVSKYPIKELKNEEYRTNLISSLKKGNLQSATFENGDQQVKKYIEACPQFKSINIYEADMTRLAQKEGKEESQSESKEIPQAQTTRKEKQKVGDDGGSEAVAPKKKGRKKSV